MVCFRVDNSLPCLVGLLTGHDTELQYEAAWCLTNISAGTQEHGLAIVKSAAPYLITFLSSSSHMLQVLQPFLIIYLTMKKFNTPETKAF